MKFKIGDKVLIHNCEGSTRYNGKIGTIMETDRMKTHSHHYWDYLCSFVDEMNYPFGTAEMEKVNIEGQMLFPFMR